jgi:cytochrome c oxidase subunit 2
MNNVEKMEKAWLTLSGIMLLVFLIALLYASVGLGITLPGPAGEIVPAEVRTTPPFDNPGVREIAPGRYEAVVISQAWVFQPSEMRFPVGAEVTFRTTSVDVVHGFEIEGTTVNAMVLPGQITEVTYTFAEPGEHLLICHEYCGRLHHTMFGRIIVE